MNADCTSVGNENGAEEEEGGKGDAVECSQQNQVAVLMMMSVVPVVVVRY